MVASPNAPGEWNVYSVYSDHLDYVVETPQKVYYVSAGNLYSYSQSDNETYAYTTHNKLNGTVVKKMAYNYEKRYLCVIYDDANIDLLYDNGTVVNIPDIRDASLSYDKEIKSVKINESGIMLGTNFGFVIVDDENHYVKESAVYGSDTPFVDTDGSRLFIINNNVLMHSPLEARHNTLEAFSKVYDVHQRSGFICDANNSVYVDESGTKLMHLYIDFTSGKIEMTTLIEASVLSDIHRYKDGFYVYTDDKIYLLDNHGNISGTIRIPQQLRGNDLFFYDNPEKVYTGNGGLGRYDISSSVPTVLMEPYIEDNVLTCVRVAFLIPSADGQRIYVSNLGSTSWNGCGYGDVIGTPMQRVNIIENGIIRDVTPLPPMTFDNGEFDEYKSLYPVEEVPLLGPAGMAVEDPDDPSIYYVCNALEGVFVIKDGMQIGKINSTNAKIYPTWGNKGGRTFAVAFDPKGNIYVGSEYNSDRKYQSVIMLPAQKRRSGEWVAGDWIELPLNGSFTGNKDIRMLFCRNSRMAFFIDGLYNGKIVAYDTSGSYENVADDKFVTWETLTDQDGKEFHPEYYTCLAEDRKGRVWVGTSEGVVEITNPLKSVSPDFRINRIKVPRNDGTNLADYLLSTDKINAIAVDHSNRKWIATEASGVYLVSENGDEILAHYTPDNSYLPEKAVYSVVCDQNSNLVYFGTATGLVSFGGNSAPPQESYSDILVYPNPVRPDYSGDITISGLMDNSLVKIADSSGNVVVQKRSEGGMVTWDGCNMSGRQVRSGVYYVFASQNTDGTSGDVAKIVIIR
ncbi:MAG: hypothetical protein K2O12_02610 [Muribaculaceae bacterium]|nr:hypothetical protein [Muribaculaceae bacterium]